MFRWIIERPTTLYGFLSGMFMSVATTALSNFALVSDTPANLDRLIKSAILAFLAAALWFVLGEYVTSLRGRIKETQDAASGTRAEAYKKSLIVISSDTRIKLYSLLMGAVACSILWPFL